MPARNYVTPLIHNLLLSNCFLRCLIKAAENTSEWRELGRIVIDVRACWSYLLKLLMAIKCFFVGWERKIPVLFQREMPQRGLKYLSKGVFNVIVLNRYMLVLTIVAILRTNACKTFLKDIWVDSPLHNRKYYLLLIERPCHKEKCRNKAKRWSWCLWRLADYTTLYIHHFFPFPAYWRVFQKTLFILTCLFGNTRHGRSFILKI